MCASFFPCLIQLPLLQILTSLVSFRLEEAAAVQMCTAQAEVFWQGWAGPGRVCLDSFLSNKVAKVLGGSRLQVGSGSPCEAQHLRSWASGHQAAGPGILFLTALQSQPHPHRTPCGLQDSHLQTRVWYCPVVATYTRAGSLGLSVVGVIVPILR